MCFKSLTLLGLISLVAFSGAKLRWKCELFDTSQETSTKTTFVEFIKNKAPEPNVPNGTNNPRTPRSTTNQKCRPRPKNGTIGPSSETETMKIQKNKEVVQRDAPGNTAPEDTDVPHIKYQRKEAHQSLDLNIGPGFEESNDQYGKSKQPLPKRFRPAELKGADELDKPLTEHLDENVMPDFEFDEDDSPPAQEDLPWCPEEIDDCETADLDKMSVSKLIELKQKCETTVSSERKENIDRLIRTERNQPEEGGIPTDRTAVLPPTGSTNCSVSPSELSNSTLEKYQKECPCEEDTSKMNEEEFEKFKKECLDIIEEPGKPKKFIRKNGRCAASQKKIDLMSDAEYDVFVKECLVAPKNIVLKKILIVDKTPECEEVDTKKMSKVEFSKYQKKCVVSKNCDDVDKSKLSQKELTRFKKVCASVTRKTKNLCDEENVETLDDDQFEKYKKECILDNDCDSIDIESLTDLEYEKFKTECQEYPINCKTVNPDDLSKKEYKMYQRECQHPSPNSPPHVYPPIDCKNTKPEELNGEKLVAYKRLCEEPSIDCQRVNPDELSEKEFRRYEEECLDGSENDECARINAEKLNEEEYKKYKKDCLLKEVNCTTADPKALSKNKYRRFEKICFKNKPDCKNIKVKELSEEEYEIFRRDCLKDEFDCSSVNVDELSDEEYEKYKQECSTKKGNDFDCDTVQPRKLTGKKLIRFKRECVKNISDCSDVKLDELSEEEYEKYAKKCLKRKPKYDCSNVDKNQLNTEELKNYKRECLENVEKDFDCETAEPRKLTRKQYKIFEENCLKSTSDCKNINPKELGDDEYSKYLKDCLKKNVDCSNVNPDKLSENELKKYKQECLGDEEFDCETIKPPNLNKKKYNSFMRKCIKKTSDCETIKVNELSDEEYEKFKLKCLRNRSEINCLSIKPDDLTESEYAQYKKECLDQEGNLNCDSINTEKLTRKQFQQYEKKCLERKSSSDCKNLNSEELNDEEYERYKKDCLRKPRFNCDNVNPDKLSDTDFKRYEQECLNRTRKTGCDSIRPDKLNDKEYAKYKRDCLDSPEKNTFDCENVKIDQLSEKEYKKYEEDCHSKNCDSINPDKLSDEEYKKYKRECLNKTRKGDCDNINPKSLNDEEYAKYKRDCLDSPIRPNFNCKTVNVDELSKKEYKKYKIECLSQNNPDCDNVNVDELGDEEFSEYKKKCSRQSTPISGPGENVEITKKVTVNKPEGRLSPDCQNVNPEQLRDKEYKEYKSKCGGGNTVTLIKKVIINNGPNGNESSISPPKETENGEGCKDVDVEKMTDYQYDAYKKYCKVNFEGEDCDDVEVKNLNEEKLREYVNKCGLFCGIDGNALTGKQKRMYDERCEGDTDELKKECKDIVIEKLGERMYGEFAEKCLEPISACSMLKSRRLVRKVYNEYRLKCKPRLQPSKEINCKEADTEKMTLEEYREYKRKCGKNGENNCDDVNVDELSEQEFVEYKKRCQVDKTKTDCKNIDLDELSREEYNKYLKKCGRSSTEESTNSDCETDEIAEMSHEKFLSNINRCKYEDDLIQKYCDNLDWKSLSKNNLNAYNEFKKLCPETPSKERTGPPGGGNPNNCTNVNVEKLSDEEYKEYKKNCGSTRKTPKQGCDDVDVSQLSGEEYRLHQKKCGSPGFGPDYPEKPNREDCYKVKIEELTSDEYLAYKKRCLNQPESPRSPGDRNPESPNETIRKTVVIKKPDGSSGIEDCSTVDVGKLSFEEYEEYKKNCKPRRKTPDCNNLDISQLSDEEYRIYKKKCGTQPGEASKSSNTPKKPSVSIEKTVVIKNPNGSEIPDNCSSVNASELSQTEYQEYKRKCKSERKSPKPNCDDVDVEKLSDEEYRLFKKNCGSRNFPKRPIPEDCTNVREEDLNEKEYADYMKRCGDYKQKVPGESVTIKKTVVINKPTKDGIDSPDSETNSGDGTPKNPSVTIEKTVVVKKPSTPKNSNDCSSVNVSELSDSEYQEYKKKCGVTRKTPKPDCDDVDINKLSDEEYRIFKNKCGMKPEESPEVSGKPSVTIEKTVKIGKPPRDGSVPPGDSTPSEPHHFDDCSNVNVAKLTDEEYNEYRRQCRPTRKTSNVDCDDVDVEKLSDEELKEHKKKCPPEYIEEVPPTSPNRMKCSDINIEELDAEEFIAYKKRCGSSSHPRPERPRGTPNERTPDSPSSEDCSDVKVEELTSEEYAAYKKRCSKNTPRRETGNPDENCSKINIDELTEKEYRAFIRRCPSEPEHVKVKKTIVIGCENKNTDEMTKEEYQKYKEECSHDSGKPHVELTKIVKIVDAPIRPGSVPDEHDDCSDQDVNKMTDEEFSKFQKKCGKFRKTFQFNCNLDVSKMTDEEFKKFRKACSKKPFKCETVNVDSLTDKEYSRYLRECGRRKKYDCKDAKVERMNAKEYEEYRKKCKTSTTKSSDECKDVKVEELSKKEYAEYKERCLKKPPTSPTDETPPTKVRRRINCSIVDESMMSDEEYADFKKHCNVKVSTDRYRPGENIILTKQVKIRTGKEKFSCYDQDVDKMSDDEYAEFEKKCLSNPHFRYDCSTVDTTNLSKEEYAKYQRECRPPKSIVLVKKLIVNKTNEPVKDGCYNRDVNEMSDEEYLEYEIKCLGRTQTELPSKPERKSSFDCHNVDLSKLSYSELEDHIKKCRTRETASTPSPTLPPVRRQSLKCSDVKTDDLDEEAYAKWVRECLETSPKTIQLEKKLIINTSPPLLSKGETVTVEKIEIREHLRPDDDEGYLEGNEDFGVRVLTGIRKKVIEGRPDDDSESETGVILVKKVIHKIPGRRRPFAIDEEDDEAGVIEVKKLIMKTAQAEPETDDSEDVEEIMRRPRKRIGPKEEVVLLSVTKKHPHSYRTKTRPEEEEPTEIVKLTKNTKNPDAVLREVRIRKHFGTGVPEEETVIQEIGGPDFRITKKTVMVPHKVRKMKSTTTTTTTPAEPEYYYDEEEVPEVITLVKAEKSSRPLRKYSRPNDEDDEYIDVKEDKPKSYIEFEGFVKVRGAPRKLRKRPTFTDSGEEPDIREVTRKVVMKPGGEDDDFKGVKLKSHRKKLILIRKIPEEVPDGSEHEVTVVKKLKVLKFGKEEEENFDDDENVEDDGKIIVRNRKRKYILDDRKKRPGEDEEEEEYVEGRVAVRGRAPKIFRWAQKPERKGSNPSITERNTQFYKIGGSDEGDIERRKRRRKEEKRPIGLEEEEDGLMRRRRRPNESEEEEEDRRRFNPRHEEESEEIGKRRKPRFEEESEEVGKKRRMPTGGAEDVIIKKLYRIGPNGKEVPSKNPEGQGESVILTKKKIFKYGPDGKKREIPDEDDESEEIKLLKKKKLYRVGPNGQRKLVRTEGDGPEQDDDDGEIVKVTKKKVYRIGPDGKREYVDEDVPQKVRKSSKDQPDVDEDEEIKLLKRRKFYRIGPDGKRELIRTEGDEPIDGEMIKVSKKKVYRIGPDGKRELVDENEERPERKSSKISNSVPISGDQPGDNSEEIVMEKKKRFYRIGPDGKRELVQEQEMNGDKPQKLKDLPEEDQDGEVMTIKKKKRFYKIGPDGKRQLIRTENGSPTNDSENGRMNDSRIGSDGNKILEDQDESIPKRKSSQKPENDQDEIVMKKRKRFYRIGPDGKRELIRTEGEEPEDNENEVGADGKRIFKEKNLSLLGRKKSTYGPQLDDQQEDDMDHEEIIMKKKKKRFYRIGPNGKRELVREEEIERDEPSGEMSHVKRKTSGLLGENKNTYSPEPLNNMDDHEEVQMKKKKRFYKIGSDGKRELVREVEGDNDGRENISQDNQENEENMMIHKKKKIYKIGPDGKRELVRTEGGDLSDSSDGKMLGLKKTKRFYKIGKDGKRELLRTEGSGTDSNGNQIVGSNRNMQRKTANTTTVSTDNQKDEDMNGEMNKDGIVANDVKPPGGHLSVDENSEEENERNRKDNEDDIPRRKNEKRKKEADVYEYEMKPRTKRTYVLDDQGKRQLVNEQTGDDEQNLNLGKLLRPKRKITEKETVDRERRESQYEQKRSSRMTRSSSNNGKHTSRSTSSSIIKTKKMQKYHKDRNVRSSGKSEEAIPEEK